MVFQVTPTCSMSGVLPKCSEHLFWIPTEPTVPEGNGSHIQGGRAVPCVLRNGSTSLTKSLRNTFGHKAAGIKNLFKVYPQGTRIHHCQHCLTPCHLSLFCYRFVFWPFMKTSHHRCLFSPGIQKSPCTWKVHLTFHKASPHRQGFYGTPLYD